MGKKVALVLASGGARGLAHIGAIEELESRGFEITSISGASMGALIGGIYAAGGLDAFKEWMKGVDKMKVFTLLDFTISMDGIVKGQKIISELKKFVPNKNIEDLDIPFTAVSTDIKHMKEVVFNNGNLFDAIRASISIPSLFKPYKIGNMVLIDGGVSNPIPLNRVERLKDDILVGVDLNAPYMVKRKSNKAPSVAEEVKTFLEKLNIPIHHLLSKEEKMLLSKEEKESMNYYTVLSDSFSMMLQSNSELSLGLYKPDVVVSIPKNAYSTMEFYKYEEIVNMGRQATIKALKQANMI